MASTLQVSISFDSSALELVSSLSHDIVDPRNSCKVGTVLFEPAEANVSEINLGQSLKRTADPKPIGTPAKKPRSAPKPVVSKPIASPPKQSSASGV